MHTTTFSGFALYIDCIIIARSTLGFGYRQRGGREIRRGWVGLDGWVS
jgi:hypothetical protein